MDKVSYALGMGIGNQLIQMGANDLNIDDFATAIKDMLAGRELKLSNREAQTIATDYFAKKEEKINAERAENGKAAKEAGADCNILFCRKVAARSRRLQTV